MPDKYEKEIEDILEDLGEEPSSGSHQPPNRPRPDESKLTARLPKQSYVKSSGAITPIKIVIVGIITFIVGWLWFRPLIWVSLGLFVLSYLLVFKKTGVTSGKYEKKWRGQVIEDKRSGIDKFKDWLRQRNP